MEESLTKKQIVEAAASAFETTVEAIHSESRQRECCDARFVIYAIFKENFKMSQAAIGGYFESTKDHATVLNGIRKFNQFKLTDTVFRRKYQKTLEIIKLTHGIDLGVLDTIALRAFLIESWLNDKANEYHPKRLKIEAELAVYKSLYMNQPSVYDTVMNEANATKD